jgi:hypothetical protein
MLEHIKSYRICDLIIVKDYYLVTVEDCDQITVEVYLYDLIFL